MYTVCFLRVCWGCWVCEVLRETNRNSLCESGLFEKFEWGVNKLDGVSSPTPKNHSLPPYTTLKTTTTMSVVHVPSDVNVSAITFSAPKVMDNGGKSVMLGYKDRNLMVQTPSLRLPYGVSVFDKMGPPKYSVDLSLAGTETSKAIADFVGFLEAFDERMIDAGMENAKAWFKNNSPNREVIKALYTPLVKVARDADGNPKPYPPTFKITLRRKPVKKGGAPPTGTALSTFNLDMYDPKAPLDAKGQISKYPADVAIEDVLCKKSNQTCVVECTGVWFAGGKFGTSWRLVQARVDSAGDQITGPVFRNDTADVSSFATKRPAAVAANEEEEDGDEETILPPPPSQAVAAPSPAPAPAPDFEDDVVAEPVAVPKKKVLKAPKAAAAK